MGRLVAIALALLSAVACQPRTVDVQAEGATLMELSRNWSAMVDSAPVEQWIDHWADDAVLMPPGGPPIRGKAAIREYVKAAGQLPDFRISWMPESMYVARSGDIAYMIERNVTSFRDSLGKLITTHGKVVTVWRKDPDGSWRNVVDMWNEALPPTS